MYRALTILIAVLVLAFMAFGIGRVFLNSDGSGKPSKQQLLAEMSQLRPSSGLAGIRYVNKISTVYVTAQGASSSGNVFDVDPAMVGWAFKSRRRHEGGEVVRYCRGRLTLSVDTNTKAGTADFGIYWASDRGSSFYCAQKVSQ